MGNRLKIRLLAALEILTERLNGCIFSKDLEALTERLVSSAMTNPARVGSHVFYHTGGHSARRMVLGIHEVKTARLASRLLRRGMTFVDIGAHVGFYTLLAARAVGRNGHVYAFEPVASNFDLLARNVAANSYGNTVTVLHKAVSDRTGWMDIFASGRDSAYSSLHKTPLAGTVGTPVETVSLDDFFRERHWPPVHVVKMDIEGSEPDALAGMIELSERMPRLKIIIEYNPMLLRAGGRSPEQFLDAIDRLGLRQKWIISWRLIPVKSSIEIRNTPNLLCEREVS